MPRCVCEAAMRSAARRAAPTALLLSVAAARGAPNAPACSGADGVVVAVAFGGWRADAVAPPGSPLAAAACAAAAAANASCFAAGAGYTGVDVGGAALPPGAAPAVERRLVELLLPRLPPAARRRIAAAAGSAQHMVCRAPAAARAGACAATVVGPDTVPAYDPAGDDKGCFETNATKNNCYNYATDVATNTFAQPGRGGGAPITDHTFTCPSMTKAALADGLQLTGTALPATPPPRGHYAALMVTPDHSGYHWVRMDSNTDVSGTHLWSGKMGIGRPLNVDSDKKPITDPRSSRFDAGWGNEFSAFCGFFVVVPSAVGIK